MQTGEQAQHDYEVLCSTDTSIMLSAPNSHGRGAMRQRKSAAAHQLNSYMQLETPEYLCNYSVKSQEKSSWTAAQDDFGNAFRAISESVQLTSSENKGMQDGWHTTVPCSLQNACERKKSSICSRLLL